MAILSRTYSDKYGVRVLRKGQQYVCETINASSTSPVEKVFANPCTNLIFRVTAGTWEIRMLSIYDKTDGKTLDDMDAITLTKGTFQVDREIVKVRFTCTDASAASPGAIWYYADGVLMLGDVPGPTYIATTCNNGTASNFFTLLKRANDEALTKAAEYDFSGNRLWQCSFDPTGQHIALTHNDATDSIIVFGWDGSSLSLLDSFSTGGSSNVTCSFDPTGQYIAVLCNKTPYFRMLSWDGSSLSQVASSSAITNIYGSVAWNKTGDLLAVFSNDYYVRVFSWNGSSLSQLDSYNLGHYATSYGYAISWSPNEQHIAVCHENSPYFTLLEWDGSNLSKTADYTLPDHGYCCSWCSDGNYIAIGHSPNGSSPWEAFAILNWDGSSLTRVAYRSFGSVNSVQFCRDGTHIAVGHQGSPYFTMLKWDGANLSKADDYTLRGDATLGVSCTNR